MVRNRWVLTSAAALTFATGAAAKSPLEKQLAGALEARKDKLNLDTTKVKSEWKLAHNGKTSGKGCVITYYSGLTDAAMAYVGPTADWNEAFFLVSGDLVP